MLVHAQNVKVPFDICIIIIAFVVVKKNAFFGGDTWWVGPLAYTAH